MRLSPLISILIACVLGAATLFLIRTYSGTETTAQPADLSASQTVIRTVPVVVAKQRLSVGDPITESNLRIMELPETAKPFDGFDTVEAVQVSEGARRTALVEIPKGMPLQASRLSPIGVQTSLAGQIKAGERAYTLRMDDVRGVAGLVLPGDRVDVLYTYNPTPGRETQIAETEILLQDIIVLALDLNADPATESPGLFKTATLAVKLDQARKLSSASQTGRLSLALRGTQETAATPLQLAEAAPPKRVISPPRKLTPRRVSTKPAKPAETTLDIEVVLGDTVETVSVPNQEAAF